MNHLSVSISDPNRNCPLDDSIYIHLAAKRLRPYRAGRRQSYGVSYRSWNSHFTSHDNRKYDEETRAQSAESRTTRIVKEPFNQARIQFTKREFAEIKKLSRATKKTILPQ